MRRTVDIVRGACGLERGHHGRWHRPVDLVCHARTGLALGCGRAEVVHAVWRKHLPCMVLIYQSGYRLNVTRSWPCARMDGGRWRSVFPIGEGGAKLHLPHRTVGSSCDRLANLLMKENYFTLRDEDD